MLVLCDFFILSLDGVDAFIEMLEIIQDIFNSVVGMFGFFCIRVDCCNRIMNVVIEKIF